MAKNNFIKLEAREGEWLTQADETVESRIFAKEVYLGTADSPDNWKYVTDEQKEALEREASPSGE